MARLVKCWNSTIICSEFLFGRSYTFELLGVQAGRDEEESRQTIGGKPSILRAFRLFLKMVPDIEQQRIVFSYSEDFYSKSDTPDEILAQKPLILDPSNPYNNVMSSFPPLAQQRFSDCAKETLRRLEAVGKEIEMGAQEFPHLKEIFLPQLADAVIMSQRWLIREQSDSTLPQPRLIVRNAALNKKTRSQIAQFLKAFSAFVYIYDIESNYEICDEMKERRLCAKHSLEETIDHLIGSKSEWTRSQETHNKYEVVFEIPIGPRRTDYLTVNSDWK